MHIVITGAAGVIGKEIVRGFAGLHDVCLIDCKPSHGNSLIICDLSNYNGNDNINNLSESGIAKLRDVFKEANVIIHLAEDSSPRATWQRVLHNSIQSTWNVLQIAVENKISRVIYASSNWAVKARELELAPDCYKPNGPKIGSEAPPHPKTPYGIAKACGEITGRMLAEEGKLESFVAVRIGWYSNTPIDNDQYRQLRIGKQDLCGLFRSCVEAKFNGFHVVYGVSAQEISPYDLSYTTRLLSWKPQELE